MISVQAARDIVLAQIPALGTERQGFFASLGRVLAEDVRAPHDVPQHNNSAMDGYAVRA
jgi:molybdopterin molybdotransferase